MTRICAHSASLRINIDWLNILVVSDFMTAGAVHISNIILHASHIIENSVKYKPFLFLLFFWDRFWSHCCYINCYIPVSIIHSLAITVVNKWCCIILRTVLFYFSVWLSICLFLYLSAWHNFCLFVCLALSLCDKNFAPMDRLSMFFIL